MITQNEISSLNLSPTKKDFVQIWNELIEVASKITERWDPTSTNESDPGIVLLKVLTGIADKLNYNIDKNILEAFMPTAAQMESMRKLCELVGYDIKYYQSAETTVRISYTGEDPLDTPLALPKFTTITNADKDITFVTTNTIPKLITNETPWVEVPCIEGQISQCESTNENNLITLAQLDDENKYYLPEIQIAENGIFIYNAITNTDNTFSDSIPWERVSNLNTQPAETRVFKFGYDSFEGRPYIAFPADIGSLIGDGLFIYFIRTSGLSGNISPRTLEVLELPSGENWSNYSAENFEVVNTDATTNGANIESISAAYNNFKKTVGTFDTLVTCRDYMNKIYSLMDASNSPYVSNILVTDIRNDINKAITLCSCDEYGILYKETPITTSVYGSSSVRVEEVSGQQNVFRFIANTQNAVTEVPLIDHFDLLLYPFKTFTQVSSGTKDLAGPYNSSFTYTEKMNREIETALADLKTYAHNLKTPEVGDIVAINNYLRLNALIATSTKVTEAEAESILQNVKVALVNEFNLRNLDFGEEIPFDSILSVIENADSRIKVVSLQEPTVLTTYSVKEESGSGATSSEYGIATTTSDGKILKVQGVNYTYVDADTGEELEYTKAKDIYNNLVLRNILAGRASLFDYDETFIANNSEKPYTVTEDITQKLADTSTNDTIKLAIEANITDVKNELYDKAIEAFMEADKKNPEKPIDSAEYSYDQVLMARGFKKGFVTIAVKVNIEKDDSGNPVATITDPVVYETYEPFSTNPETKDIIKDGIVNDVKRVEAECEIQSTENTFRNIKLGKNEVIKFRAPNLITTKTFPAYIYYHFEHKDATNNLGADADTPDGYGSFAKAMTLSDFINQDQVGVKAFFERLWDTAGISFSSKDYTFEAEPSDAGKPKIPSSGKLAEIFNTAIAVEADVQLQVIKRDPETKEPINPVEYEDYSSKIFTRLSDFTTVLNEHFSNKNNTTKVTFRYYPLTYHTSSIWSSCIKEFNTDLPAGDTILWKLSSTSSHPRGKFVTESGKKLLAMDGDTLSNGAVGEVAYICTDFGSNPNYSLIAEKNEFELGSNDKLYIHYTPSSTSEDGETITAEPISIVYEGGGEEPVIIKPSGFTLMPSEDVHKQGTSWKKTDVDFGKHGTQNLLALAPNEQIELRSISKVVLDKTARFYKNFDNIELESGNINKEINYELKDGEYLFYTDKSTQEAAYYGSGSVITLSPGAFIPKATEPIEVSQILEQGLHKVPWSDDILLNKTRKITITEYQYVTLVEGDTLNTLTVAAEAGNNGYKINNKKWTKCLSTTENPITYTLAGEESQKKLPRIELKTGPSTSWEVCSFLELSTSPGYSQQLRMADNKIKDSDTATATIKNKLKVYTEADRDAEPLVTIEPATKDDPVSFKLSTIAQAASGNFEKTDSDLEDDIDDSTMQLKVFKEESPSFIELSSVDEPVTPISASSPNKYYSPVEPTASNLNNYWTRLEVGSQLSKPEGKPAALNLNFMVPSADVFGIFSVYLDVPEDKLSTGGYNIPNSGSRVFIDIPKEFGSFSTDSQADEAIISIFNCRAHGSLNEHRWWPSGIDSENSNRLYLRAGLNCIRVNKSCNLTIKAEKGATGSLLYDNMRLVKGRETHGINLALLDPDATYNTLSDTDKNSKAAKLAQRILDNLAKLDKNNDFYYNVPIENSLAIEFDKNISSFSNPYTLYDINNVNNAFVISKLDVKYLKDGLKIAKSSKY